MQNVKYKHLNKSQKIGVQQRFEFLIGKRIEEKEETQGGGDLASLHPPTVGSRGTNSLLTAVHASISIVPGDNNSVCAQLSVNVCVRVSIVHGKWQKSCSEVTDKQYRAATENLCGSKCFLVSDDWAKCHTNGSIRGHSAKMSATPTRFH